MKKAKVLLAGALVLALGLVMGCKQNEELSVEEHRQGADKYEHVWEATYENDQYVRSALQFGKGNSVNITKADVKVKMIYPNQGKAGILFGVNPRPVTADGGEKTVYDFYAFAFGKNRTTNKLEAYVDYYQGLESFNEKGGTSEKFGVSSNVALVNKAFEGFTGDANAPITVVMKVSMTENSGANDVKDGTWNLSITNEDGTVTYWTASNVTGLAEAKKGTNGLTETNFKESGAIYSYGMLSAEENPKKADTKWNLVADSVLPDNIYLSAE